MKPARPTADLLIALGVVTIVPAVASGAATLLRGAEEAIDPSGCFARASVHHILQLALTVLVLTVRSGRRLSEWGFNLREFGVSAKIFGWFCVAYLVPVLFVNVLPSLRSGVPPAFGCPPTSRNIAGTLAFQFLLSGTCEEPLFRGFVMGFLARSWRGHVHIGKLAFPVTGLWATLLFMLAHVNIGVAPLSIQASAGQQLWALGLGLYYAAVYARTGSLLAPILSHGYSNGVIFVILYTMAAAMN